MEINMKKSKKREIRFNYESSVAVIPASALKYIDKAKKFDLKVLFLLASNEISGKEDRVSAIAEILDCGEDDVLGALSFWNGVGVIDTADTEEPTDPQKKQEKTEEGGKKADTPKRTKVSELPQYTTEELNQLLEKNESMCDLIDECQQILGKIFNTGDVKILVGLIDFLGLDEEYIVVLMHYCAETDKRSMRYLEKVAVSCLDDGITEATVLQAELRSREEKKSFEGSVRNMFGIGSRSFTKKEKSSISAWRENYAFGLDIIGKAYEITVNATGKASIPYANAIIEKWYAEGLKTLEEIEAYLIKDKAEHGEGAVSFDVDDFFDAALKRTYSNESKENK